MKTPSAESPYWVQTLAGLPLAYRTPDAFGGSRHCDVRDIERGERVKDGVHHRRRGRDRAAFSHALDAQRVRRARHKAEID